jgi:malonyl-CoA O-methyltransferase
MTILAASEAYPLWAPNYAAETAISWIENELVSALTPPLAGLRLLDAGCGTGRRLRDLGAKQAVGVDLCREMVDAGAADLRGNPRVKILTADVRAMPFAAGSFDVVWCRLVIGHVRDCGSIYRELARVTAPGRRVIVTDFHEAAQAAGHRRSFRAGDEVFEVEHHVHSMAKQLREAAGAGLENVAVRPGRVGASVEHIYRSTGKSDLFLEQVGLPVVLALSFRRGA